ncbi:MAG: PLP-dependent transferase [Gammaproteobacteria bacterium]|nr:PLP-dependent transferase [Gammaproteobacteria bacterium]
MSESFKPATMVNHPPAVAVPADNHPIVGPIYQSVKFEFESLADTLAALRGSRPGFYYQRTSNPTLRQLELTLAGLQRREDGIVCASGVGAMAQALIALSRAGDHVLAFVEIYGPTRYVMQRILARFGVTLTLLSIEDDAGIARVLRTMPTRLVVFESPTNPMNRIADVAAITRAARAAGALTVLDNTLAGPHQHGEFDVDLYVHSLTKYAAGHGDVMGGAAIGSAELIERLRPEFTLLGGVLDPHAAFLIQRGLKTYAVRYTAQSASALRIARFLADQPGVRRVHYPGLEQHPRHALAAAQMREWGAVVSFELQGGGPAGQRFAEALRLFALTASLGATDSLVQPPQLLTTHGLTSEQLALSGVGPATVRLAVGLEDCDELLADLDAALRVANG